MTIKMFSASVAASADDASQTISTGVVGLTSADLNPITDRIIGFRFRGVTIAPGAPILSATIQFTSNTSASGTNNATIWCEATADALIFANTAGSKLTDRTKTTASVAWTIPDPWADGARGTAQLTPDLTTIVSEWNALPGRSVGDDIVFLIQGGPNNRQFVTWDHTSRQEATLTIEWERVFTSNIVTTIPLVGVPAVKSEFHANWTTIKNENLALQGAIEDLENALAENATVFDVELFRGAYADTATGNAAMFQAAIDAATANGGGMVFYSRDYVCNKIFLKSRVCLYGYHHLLNFRGNIPADGHAIDIAGDQITLWRVRAEIDTDADAVVRPSASINDLLIDDCEFSSDVATGNMSAFVQLQDQECKRITCRSSRFHHGRGGFYFNDSVAGIDRAFEDVFFVNNRCWNLRNEGFGINSPGVLGTGARRIVVTDNTFLNTADTVVGGTGSFAVMSFAGCNDVEVSGNLIDGFAAGIWVEDECERINIHHNILRRSITSNLVNGNNRVLAVHGASRWSQFCNNIIEDVDNSDGAAVHIAHDSSTSSFGWKVNENIIKDITGTGISMSSTGGPCEVKSNLIINAGGKGIGIADNVNVIDNVVDNSADWAYRTGGGIIAKAKFEGNLAQNMPSGVARLGREGGAGGLLDLDGGCHREVAIVDGISAYETFFLTNKVCKGDLLVTAWSGGSEYVKDVPIRYSLTTRWQLDGTAYTDAITAGTLVTGIEIQIGGPDGHLRIRASSTAATVNIKASLRGFARL